MAAALSPQFRPDAGLQPREQRTRTLLTQLNMASSAKPVYAGLGASSMREQHAVSRDQQFSDILREVTTAQRPCHPDAETAETSETSRLLNKAVYKLSTASFDDGLEERGHYAPTYDVGEADVTSNASSGSVTPISLRRSGATAPVAPVDIFTNELPGFLITPVSRCHPPRRRKSTSAGLERAQQQPAYEYAMWQETQGLPTRGVYTNRKSAPARVPVRVSGLRCSPPPAPQIRTSRRGDITAFGAGAPRFPTVYRAKTTSGQH
jgi:hypothetical protein